MILYMKQSDKEMILSLYLSFFRKRLKLAFIRYKDFAIN